MSEYSYQGTELDLFQHAVRWKGYYAGILKPFIIGDVLEVGAGIGGTTRLLCGPTPRSWTCLEPDGQIASRLAESLATLPLPLPSEVLTGTLESLPPVRTFDTLLYIDVLEHIEDDYAELRLAAARLRPGGHVIVLSPAHNWLFSPFDAAIGHFRRYSRKSLLAVAPDSLQLVKAFYLDSVGMAASFANRMFLKASSPTLAQIHFWDRNLVRASQLVDPLVGRRMGKTVIAIWRRPT